MDISRFGFRRFTVGTAVFLAFALASELSAQTPTPTPLRLLNVSGRVDVRQGDMVGIAGFIINAPPPPVGPLPTPIEKEQVVVRALGPSLEVNGQPIPNTLPDPFLELHDSSGHLIASNNNWRSDQQAEIEATGLAPSDDRESAILADLPPGQYTGIIRGANGGTGIGLIEVYDLPSDMSALRLVNLSTRATAETGDQVLIGGVIIGGDDSGAILFRAIGPDLADHGVSGALADPTLRLYDGNGMLLASNDNWRDTQEQEIMATDLAPQNDLDSAILQILSAGNYTAIVEGRMIADDTPAGVALLEVYNLQ